VLSQAVWLRTSLDRINISATTYELKELLYSSTADVGTPWLCRSLRTLTLTTSIVLCRIHYWVSEVRLLTSRQPPLPQPVETGSTYRLTCTLPPTRKCDVTANAALRLIGVSRTPQHITNRRPMLIESTIARSHHNFWDWCCYLVKN
jgi:hypothetical protein